MRTIKTLERLKIAVIDIHNEKAFIIGLAFEWSISLDQNDVSQSSGTKVDIEGQVEGDGRCASQGCRTPRSRDK